MNLKMFEALRVTPPTMLKEDEESAIIQPFLRRMTPPPWADDVLLMGNKWYKKWLGKQQAPTTQGRRSTQDDDDSDIKESKALDSMRFKLLRGVGLAAGDAMVGRTAMKSLQQVTNDIAHQRGMRRITAFRAPGGGGASGEASGNKFVVIGNDGDRDSAVWHEVGHHLDSSAEANVALHPVELLRREAKASKGKSTELLRKWHAGYVRSARNATPGFAKLYRKDASLRLHKESAGPGTQHKYLRKEGHEYIYPESITSSNAPKFPHEANVLYITGRSGSGKSTMARSVLAKLRRQGYEAKHIELDNYWDDASKAIKLLRKKPWYPMVGSPLKAIRAIQGMAKGNPDTRYVVEGVQIATHRNALPKDAAVVVKSTGLLRSLYRAFVTRDDFRNYLVPKFGYWGAFKQLGVEAKMKYKWHKQVAALQKRINKQQASTTQGRRSKVKESKPFSEMNLKETVALIDSKLKESII